MSIINKSLNENNVRWIKSNEEAIWVVARDICKLFNIKSIKKNIDLINPKYKKLSKFKTKGGRKNLTIISEPAIYSLAFKSDTKEANDFKELLIEDILPSIRSSGEYELNHSRNILLKFLKEIAASQKIKLPKENLPPGFENMSVEEQLRETERFKEIAKYNSNSFYEESPDPNTSYLDLFTFD